MRNLFELTEEEGIERDVNSFVGGLRKRVSILTLWEAFIYLEMLDNQMKIWSIVEKMADENYDKIKDLRITGFYSSFLRVRRILRKYISDWAPRSRLGVELLKS